MTLQGIQLEVLQTVATILEATSAQEVEDSQIAEEIEMDINLVRNSLKALAEAGHVRLEKMETLSGLAYNAFLTSKGETTLEESRHLASEKL